MTYLHKKGRVFCRNMVFAIMLLITLQAAAATTLDDNVTSSWTMDNDDITGVTIEDVGPGGYDGTNNGATTGATGIINEALDFESANFDYVVMGDVSDFDFGDNNFSVNLWVYPDDQSNYYIVLSKSDTSYGIDSYNIQLGTDGTIYYFTGTASTGESQQCTAPLLTPNSWQMITVSLANNDQVNIYINGTECSSYAAQTYTAWHTLTNTNNFYLGSKGGSVRNYNGLMDEVTIWNNRFLTQADTTELYNSGVGKQYPYSVQNFTVTVLDNYTGAPVNGINVTINGTTFENPTGNTVSTHIKVNDTNNYDINISGLSHFDRELFNISVTDHLTTSLYQSQISFQSYNLIFNDTINANYTINGTNNTVFYLNEGEHTVLVEPAGYFARNHSFNVTALDNLTLSVYGLYNARVLISPRDIINNNTIQNNTISVINGTFNQTISGVYNYTFNLTTGEYDVYIDSPTRASYQENFTLTDTGTSIHYAYLYAYNSLWVYAFNQETSANIISFNVTVENLNNSYSVSTTDGRAELNQILSGTYDVVVSAGGYADATYSVTVTDNSHQELNAFLSTSEDTFIFTVKDKSTDNIIEGATIIQQRFINGTLTVVATENSDISGRIQFSYTGGVEYTFEASYTDYVTKNFNLEILFTEYTLYLTPETVSSPDVYIDDVSVTNNGYTFRNNATSHISYYFSSSLGSLEYYYINITLPNGSIISAVGTSAAGGSINASAVVNGIIYGQSATVRYGYKSTFNTGYKHYSRIYAFTTWEAGEGSVQSFITDTSDISDLEKVFWATVITIIITGLAGLAGLFTGQPGVFAAAAALICFSVFAALGFINWVVIGFVGFILVMFIIAGLMNR